MVMERKTVPVPCSCSDPQQLYRYHGFALFVLGWETQDARVNGISRQLHNSCKMLTSSGETHLFITQLCSRVITGAVHQPGVGRDPNVVSYCKEPCLV